MVAFGSWIFAATIFVSGVLSNLDTDVCSLVKESFGLVPPALPENFEIEGEHVEFLTKTKTWEAMYFDNKYLRAKYITLLSGMEYHLLFDYNTSQILKYMRVHPGVPITKDSLSSECSAVQMEDAEQSFIFGYRDMKTNYSRMYDANRVLRFGGPYPYAFNGTDSLQDRGMKTNSFWGCVYEKDIDRTLSMRYNFSSDDLAPSGGDKDYVLTGMKTLAYESIPLGVDIRRARKDVNSSEGAVLPDFDTSFSFSWFKANPIFAERDFQIPPWMHCDNYRGWKRMPRLPMAFSVRVENIGFNQDIMGKKISVEMLSTFELYYYNEKGLARRDYTPTTEADSDLIKEFGNYGRVKTVYDFSIGVIFITHLSTGRCFIRTIRNEDYFDFSKNKNYDEMASPEDLFQMDQKNMEYKGQYFFRDINCDAWSGKVFNTDENRTLIKETYMATNGWNSETDETVQFGVPLRHTIISNVREKEYSQYVEEQNFYKFKAYAPPLRTFDVSECAEQIAHNFYAIQLNVQADNEKFILSYKFQFLEASQDYLSEIAQVGSPLRIQRLDVINVQSHYFLIFALTEKPDPRSDTPYPIKGANLKEAINFIRIVVEYGSFVINVFNPKTKEAETVSAVPGGLYQWFPGGKFFSVTKNDDSSVRLSSEQTPFYDSTNIHSWVLYDDTPSKKKKGMSSGSLAGLAIGMLLIGIAIGIAGMYFYIRKTYDPIEQIAMEKQTP